MAAKPVRKVKQQRSRTGARGKTTTTTTTSPRSALPSPPLLSQATEGADEPMVLSAPPLGRSGDVKVRKPVHDALCGVSRLFASFVQGTTGRRSVALRLDLDEGFPNLPLDTLPDRLSALQQAGAARCVAILGADFNVLSIYFGGKKLR